LQLDPNRILGCATVYGGKTSHSAIIVRSLGIPFVVGLGEYLNQVQDGQLIIVDGVNGKIIIEPNEDQISTYIRLMLKRNDEQDEPPFIKAATTSDHYPVELMANISSLNCARNAKRNGAVGIGLFRTEFLYLNRTTPPTEQEQFEVYREAANIFGDTAPIIIRTLDIGGDKQAQFYPQEQEQNSLLGKRGIRISLEQVELFKTQLRAILRASVYGTIKIMFPMIAVMSEWNRAISILEEVKEEFKSLQINYNHELEVGMMIEVPAAALNAAQFASKVDFISIGTNDLLQYLMAADRSDPSLGYLNNGYHPFVLRLIQQVIQSAQQHNKWVSMCGDLAGQPLAVALFLGMGLRKFSMNPNELAQVRTKVRLLEYSKMVAVSKDAMELDEADDVLEFIINNC
jgi:phosphotransferase system enzyme I (PtsI)